MPPPVGHLDYYTRHGINPVRYDTSDLRLHLDRRGSLYRTLGVPPLAIRGSRVLEVAPGTGQNSLYLAHQGPAALTLVEPNPVARRDILAVYEAAAGVVTPPAVVPSRLEDYDPEERFDLVVCENWLGKSDHEVGLLRKLGALVGTGGLLVVTTVSPVGLLPNLLRRALSTRLAPAELAFGERTEILTRAFAPHLATVSAMTRGVEDWVHDNMMNPAYLGVVLTLPRLLDVLGGEFDALGTSPRFGTDWRWFKSLCGTARDFNGHLRGEYHSALHNFLDYRADFGGREAGRNEPLEAGALSLVDAIHRWEQGDADRDAVTAVLRGLGHTVSDLPPQYAAALDEFIDVFERPEPTPEAVAKMTRLGPLFGRETIYISLEKRSPVREGM